MANDTEHRETRAGKSGRQGAPAASVGRRALLRVLLADPNRLFMTGIRRALEGDEEIEVVGEVSSSADLLPLIAETSPDVVLLDLAMQPFEGLSPVEQIRELHPDVKIVIFSDRDLERVPAAIGQGAAGYIVKTINPRDLASALRLAIDASVFHALGLQARPQGRAERPAGLTDRELTILKGVARGLSNQAIARELWVTEQTVKFHLTNVYRKLGVSNRTEATRFAFVHGLVDPEDDPS